MATITDKLPSHKSDIIIIGGGVIGISLAYHLSNLGYESTIIEKEAVTCSHASAKNAGMIRQLYKNELLSEWAYEGIRSWPNEIKDFCFRETGSLVIGRTPPQHLPKVFKLGSLKTETSDQPYVYTETDGLLSSEEYVAALRLKAVGSGKCEIITKTKICEISRLASGNWELLSENNQKFECGLLVNGSGAWLNSFLSQNGLQVEAQPFVRHLFVSQGWEDRNENYNLPNHGFYWDELAGWYRRDWDKETKLVSLCETEPANPDTYLPKEDVSVKLAESLLSNPHIKAQNIKIGVSWHCFRTYTEDQLPIVGFDEVHPNFYWLAAFGGYGMSTSFAATKYAAQEIAGRKSLISLTLNSKRVKTPVVERRQEG